MHTDSIFFYGTGGHAKVVLEALLLSSTTSAENIVVLDDNPACFGNDFLGYAVSSGQEVNTKEKGSFHIAIGNNAIRKRLSSKLVTLLHQPLSIMHPSALISSYSQIETGCFLAARAIVGPYATLMNGVIVNHGAIIDHDCHIGAFSHIAPNATLGGGVRIGQEVLIGAGAVILPGVSVGNCAVVGAGAVVIKDVLENSTVVGVPGHQIHLENKL